MMISETAFSTLLLYAKIANKIVVDITSEMVTMLKTQQAFSGVSRLLQTEVDIAKRLIDN